MAPAHITAFGTALFAIDALAPVPAGVQTFCTLQSSRRVASFCSMTMELPIAMIALVVPMAMPAHPALRRSTDVCFGRQKHDP
jgi:hypothetical protein